jgi:hypothetical protein
MKKGYIIVCAYICDSNAPRGRRGISSEVVLSGWIETGNINDRAAALYTSLRSVFIVLIDPKADANWDVVAKRMDGQSTLGQFPYTEAQRAASCG